MQFKYAKRLHNRDQVHLKLDKDWVEGYVVGDYELSANGKDIYLNIQTKFGYHSKVHHKDLK